MKTHADIIKSVGASKIAADRGLSIHTVRSWILRDSIPSQNWADFAGAGYCSIDELAKAAAQKRQAA